MSYCSAKVLSSYQYITMVWIHSLLFTFGLVIIQHQYINAVFCKFVAETYLFLVKLTCVTNWLLWFDEKRNNFGLSCNRKRKSKLTNGLDPFFVFHFLVVHQLTSTSAFFRKFATKRLRILSSFWHSIYIRTISSNRLSYQACIL